MLVSGNLSKQENPNTALFKFCIELKFSDLIGQVGVEKLRKNGQLVSQVSNSIDAIIPFLEFTVHQVTNYLLHIFLIIPS